MVCHCACSSCETNDEGVQIEASKSNEQEKISTENASEATQRCVQTNAQSSRAACRLPAQGASSKMVRNRVKPALGGAGPREIQCTKANPNELGLPTKL